MKILMIADMEGVSGVVHPEALSQARNPTEYARARKLMTADVNAAVQGAVDAGAESVLIMEGHAIMRCILIDELHEKASVIQGPTSQKPLCQFHHVDQKFDAAVFVGFHAMAGNEVGILAHTWSGAVVYSFKINGKQVGETAINAALCGHVYGIPLVAVTGCSELAKESKETVGPWVQTVVTKEALGSKLANCYSTKKTLQDIQNVVQQAIDQRSRAEVFTCVEPTKKHLLWER